MTIAQIFSMMKDIESQREEVMMRTKKFGLDKIMHKRMRSLWVERHKK